MNIAALAQILGLLVLVVVVLAIVVIAARRSALTRSGAIDVCWRPSRARGTMTADGRGWVLGQGRFRDNEFLMYRSFSPLPGAARKLRRESLKLGSRRGPVGTEPDLLPVGSVIVRCTDGGSRPRAGAVRRGAHRTAVLARIASAGHPLGEAVPPGRPQDDLIASNSVRLSLCPDRRPAPTARLPPGSPPWPE